MKTASHWADLKPRRRLIPWRRQLARINYKLSQQVERIQAKRTASTAKAAYIRRIAKQLNRDGKLNHILIFRAR